MGADLPNGHFCTSSHIVTLKENYLQAMENAADPKMRVTQ